MPTVDQLFLAVTLVAALGCGLVAGVFFAFSSFVMAALAHRPAAEGMTAMQSINVVVLRSLFMVAFLGTAAVCVAASIAALAHGGEPGSGWMLIGSLLYLVGALFVTIAFNVPRNEALARAAPAGPEGAQLWADYLKTWTAWNHVRTISSLAAAVAFGIALCKQ